MGFGDDWADCMRSKGMPAITFDGLGEIKDFIEELHSAWENAGGEAETTLGALVAVGAVTGIDEAALGAAAGLTVLVYISACVACLATASFDALRDLFAESPPQPFMAEQLADLGVHLEGTATA